MIHPVRHQRGEKKAVFVREPEVAKCEVKAISTRDPAARGSVSYDIPLRSFDVTHGFKEHVAYLSGEGKKPAHRACLCKLFQESRCRQARKCNSLHVDPKEIARLRGEHGVALEETFVNEVVVQGSVPGEKGESKLATFAVRFPAVLKTEGASTCKRDTLHPPPQLPEGVAPRAHVVPSLLCPHFNPSLKGTGECPAGTACGFVHVKHEELKEANLQRLRTPCCWYHGDAEFAPYTEKHIALFFKQERIPDGAAAVTRGLTTLVASKRRVELSCQHVCALHIKSRCKYGRSCGKVHLCRVWAERARVLPEADAASRAESNAMQKKPTSVRQNASFVSSPEGGALLALSGVCAESQQTGHAAVRPAMYHTHQHAHVVDDEDDEMPPLAEPEEEHPDLSGMVAAVRRVLHEEDQQSVTSDVPSSSPSNSTDSCDHTDDFAPPSSFEASNQAHLKHAMQYGQAPQRPQQPMHLYLTHQHQQQPTPFESVFTWGRLQ